METANRFIPFIRFLQYSLVSSSFLVLPSYSFFIFLVRLYLFDGQFPIFPIICRFSLSILIFLDLVVLLICFYPVSWLYILTACIRVSNSFSFLANSLMSSMCIRWLIISCDFLSLYPALHFLSMYLIGILAMINSNFDSASSWYMLLWIFLFQLSFSLLLSIPLSRFL